MSFLTTKEYLYAFAAHCNIAVTIGGSGSGGCCEWILYVRSAFLLVYYPAIVHCRNISDTRLHNHFRQNYLKIL